MQGLFIAGATEKYFRDTGGGYGNLLCHITAAQDMGLRIEVWVAPIVGMVWKMRFAFCGDQDGRELNRRAFTHKLCDGLVEFVPSVRDGLVPTQQRLPLRGFFESRFELRIGRRPFSLGFDPLRKFSDGS